MKFSSALACLIILSILLLTGCATKPSLLETNPIGKEYTGSITFRNKTVPLPEGTWKVIGTELKDSFFRVVLLKNTSGKVMEDSIIIHVETNATIRDRGYVKTKDFEKSDYHYSEIFNNNDGEAQDAFFVKHTRMSMNTKREHLKKAFNYLIENNYIVPTVLIEGRHRFTGKNIKRKYLLFSYYKNPEAEGFAPPSNSDWHTSDWHPLHISKDQKKEAYIDNFIELSKTMHVQLKNGFGK